MKENKTRILLLLLFFGAICFGSGAFYGQFMLTEKGFVFEEAAEEAGDTEESVPTKNASGAEHEKRNDTTTKVNINQATVDDLQAVPGLGAVTAEKIVSSRNDAGDFENINDLVERGILGKGKLEQIAPYLEAE